jgi:hypothetical protein
VVFLFRFVPCLKRRGTIISPHTGKTRGFRSLEIKKDFI